MFNARALLLVASGAVFLLGISTNPDATAIEKPGSDPTRPSESIKVEGQGDVQVEESQQSAGKNGSDAPKINDDMYQVTIQFKELYYYKMYEIPKTTPANDLAYILQEPAEMALFAYINGKRMFVGAGTVEDHTTYPLRSSTTIKLPSDMPLSIMIVGIEADWCFRYHYPSDISTEVIAANGNIERLTELAKSLRPEGDDCNQPLGNSYHPLSFISKVYQPPTYGTGSHEVEPGIGDTFLDDSTIVGSLSDPDYKIKYTINAIHIPPVNVVK